METLEPLFDADRALVYGIGGGGDVVSTVPTARLLESRGTEVVLGGITWERVVTDPTPGPRPIEDLDAVHPVNDVVALATEDTETTCGAPTTEAAVAAAVENEVALIDVSGGAAGLAAGLADAVERLDFDAVVAVDGGGDALAAGDEPGLRSPLADAVSLAALDDLAVPTPLGVLGYGSDGELTVPEIDEAIADVAASGGLLGAWGITPRVADELDGVLERVDSEASRLPVEASRGRIGDRSIRDGRRTVDLSPASAVTFYLDGGSVARRSDPVARVAGTDSLDAADEALRDAGYATELAYERRTLADADGDSDPD